MVEPSAVFQDIRKPLHAPSERVVTVRVWKRVSTSDSLTCDPEVVGFCVCRRWGLDVPRLLPVFPHARKSGVGTCFNTRAESQVPSVKRQVPSSEIFFTRSESASTGLWHLVPGTWNLEFPPLGGQGALAIATIFTIFEAKYSSPW